MVCFSTISAQPAQDEKCKRRNLNNVRELCLSIASGQRGTKPASALLGGLGGDPVCPVAPIAHLQASGVLIVLDSGQTQMLSYPVLHGGETSEDTHLYGRASPPLTRLCGARPRPAPVWLLLSLAQRPGQLAAVSTHDEKDCPQGRA